MHWTSYLTFRGMNRPERTVTKDLRRDGFYCFLNEALAPGEWIDCEIIGPAHLPDHDATISLRCRARVIRVEKIDNEERYGLACRLEDYRLIYNPPPQAEITRSI